MYIACANCTNVTDCEAKRVDACVKNIDVMGKTACLENLTCPDMCKIAKGYNICNTTESPITFKSAYDKCLEVCIKEELFNV